MRTPPSLAIPRLTDQFSDQPLRRDAAAGVCVTRSLLALAVIGLAGCTSVPLPTWVPAPIRPASSPAPTSAPQVQQAPQPAPASTGVQVTPVPPPSLPQVSPPAASAPAVVAPTAAALPYSAAVAARFPAPSVIYSTPGLQAGRTSYTSTSEMQGWLREQGSAASRAGIKSAVLSIGTSQRGEPIEALLLTRAASTDPAAVAANGHPTVLLVGQQHGDEPAGSEALLVIARELAQGLLQPSLERVNVIIVPRANPDGAASGRAVTANGTDMHRDHLLLATPEAQALARLQRDYRPTVVLDAHEYTVMAPYLEKFGGIQKFDALIQYPTTANLPEFLTKAAEEWYRRPLLAALRTRGLNGEWYHTTSGDLADKKVAMGGARLDASRNVNGLKNVISLQIETRGAGIGRLDLQRRVHTHVTAITSVLASTAQRASELGQLRPYVEKETSAMACKGDAVIEAGLTPARYELMLLDPATGADKPVMVDWDSALALRPLKARARPCGYWLDASAATAVERLRLQGVQVFRVAEAGSMLGDRYQETNRADTDAGIRVQVNVTRGVVDVPRGSFFVPLNQPLANLALAALEPDAPDSFFANRLIPALQHTVRVMADPAVRLEELP
ncbi:M14 family zinc carboxypeptidase [Polaromonas sp. YR568]|uniref:M14 family metallopeptidase n=1 Tax=Polaromonas sp. YR568 TaxID=1855301 RepID=UPI003137F04E